MAAMILRCNCGALKNAAPYRCNTPTTFICGECQKRSANASDSGGRTGGSSIARDRKPRTVRSFSELRSGS